MENPISLILEASTSKTEQIRSSPSSPKAKSGKKFLAKKELTPDSDKNKDKEAGPSKFWYCYGCSCPRYHKGKFPECSVNYKRDPKVSLRFLEKMHFFTDEDVLKSRVVCNWRVSSISSGNNHNTHRNRNKITLRPRFYTVMMEFKFPYHLSKT